MRASTRIRKAVVGGGRQVLLVLLALAVAGVLVLALLQGQPQASSAPDATEANPASNAAEPTPSAATPSAAGTPSAEEPLSMEAVRPASIAIPAMKVDTSLKVLGKKQNKYVELPKKPSQPGWYKNSVTPGELGISSVIGYIRKSEKKPGVFVQLSKLDKGDRITITRTDGSAAVFAVDKIKSYPVKDFPADKVYGQSDSTSELRLITCGGTLKPKDPPSNVVVYAHLIDTKRSDA